MKFIAHEKTFSYYNYYHAVAMQFTGLMCSDHRLCYNRKRLCSGTKGSRNVGVQTIWHQLLCSPNQIEEDGNWSTLDLNPLQAKLFFGDAATDDIGKPKIFDGGNLQDKLRLGGLLEGTPVMVYNTAGHQCLSTRISSKETPIDTSKLPSGIYIVKAGKTVIKFIKK